MTIYKYITAENGIKVLKNGSLRFTQPSALNDPFEFSPTLEATEAVMAEIDARNRAHKLMNHDLAQAVTDYDRRCKRINAYMPQYRQFIKQNGDRFVILCLSKNEKSILMWSHYAQNHTGIIIGFDADHGFFHPGGWGELTAVQYSDKRPTLLPNGDNTEQFKRLAFSKNCEWGYEQELRMLRVCDQADEKIASNGELICLFNFPPDCIREVIFGYRMPEDRRKEIGILVQEKYPSVELFESTPHERLYQMDISVSSKLSGVMSVPSE